MIWAYGCTNTGCSITSKEGRTTLVCSTSTEMYYFVLFRKLHGLVGQTFSPFVGTTSKNERGTAHFSRTHSWLQFEKKMQIGQELLPSQRIKSNYPDFF